MDIKKLIEEVEQVSQLYTSKFNIERNGDWFVLKLQEEMGELIQSYLMMIGKARTKGKTKKEIKQDFDNEVADVLAHILLLAKHYDVDVESIMKEKWLKWKKYK